MLIWGLLKEIWVTSSLLLVLKHWIWLFRPLDLAFPLPEFLEAYSTHHSFLLNSCPLIPCSFSPLAFFLLPLMYKLLWDLDLCICPFLCLEQLSSALSWSISSQDWFHLIIQTWAHIFPWGSAFSIQLKLVPFKYLLSCSLHSTGQTLNKLFLVVVRAKKKNNVADRRSCHLLRWRKRWEKWLNFESI